MSISLPGVPGDIKIGEIWSITIEYSDGATANFTGEVKDFDSKHVTITGGTNIELSYTYPSEGGPRRVTYKKIRNRLPKRHGSIILAFNHAFFKDIPMILRENGWEWLTPYPDSNRVKTSDLPVDVKILHEAE
jgi:hypothetical protein